METKKHNGVISLWKFIFAFGVVCCHIAEFATIDPKKLIIPGGAIGVEFFFVVSGFLMCKKLMSYTEPSPNVGIEAGKYIWGKMKQHFPYVLIGCILGILSRIIYEKWGLSSYAYSIIDGLFLRMTGVKYVAVNGPTWYISSMLLCMLLIYPFLRKNREKYVYIAAPLITIMVLGWLNKNMGLSLKGPMVMVDKFTYKGNLRALAELNLGIFLYPLCMKFSKIKISNFGRALLTLIQVFCFAMPLVLSYFVERVTHYDIFLLASVTIGIFISFSGQLYGMKLCGNKFFAHLERLSLPMFTVHYHIARFIGKRIVMDQNGYYKGFLLIFVIAIVVAEILLYVIEGCRRRKVLPRVFGRLFVKPEGRTVSYEKQEGDTRFYITAVMLSLAVVAAVAAMFMTR